MNHAVTDKSIAQLRWFVELTIRQAWRLLVAVFGTTVLMLGVVMIFTPGPAFVVMPIGLSILAAEFVWARKMLRRAKIVAKRKLRQLRNARQ